MATTKTIDCTKLKKLPPQTLVLLEAVHPDDDYYPVKESVEGRIFETFGSQEAIVYSREEFTIPADSDWDEEKKWVGSTLHFSDATFIVLNDPDGNY